MRWLVLAGTVAAAAGRATLLAQRQQIGATHSRALLRKRAAQQPPAGAHPVVGNSPENPLNILDYQVAQPTPLPAVQDGQYCRGGACQYRVTPLPWVAPTTPPPIMYPPSNREFCRGLSCLPAMGMPTNPTMDKFRFDCAHLYNDVGKMHGEEGSRDLNDVKKSFFTWCSGKFPPPLIGACDGLSDVLVMAMHSRVDAAHVGGVDEICTDTFLFIDFMRTAEIDLKLLPGTFPTPPAFIKEQVRIHKVFLPSNLDDQVGTFTPRGRAWRKQAMRMYKAYGFGTTEPLYPVSAASLLQEGQVFPGVSGSGEQDPYSAQYEMDPPCVHGVTKGKLKYQILAGAPPVEVDGPRFEFCANEFAEIMAGFAQTGTMVRTMTKDWCTWQSSVTSWVGQADPLGHPEWDFRRCNNMMTLLSFALRNHLDTGLTSGNVCTQLFLSIGAIDWHDQAVKDAWAAATARTIQAPGLTTTADPALKKAMEEAQEYAKNLYGKMQGQKDMFNNLNDVKMDESAFALVKAPPAPTIPPPPLPTDSFKELEN